MPWTNLRLVTADGQAFTTSDGKTFCTADKVYEAGENTWDNRAFVELYPPSADKETLLSTSGGYTALLEPLDGSVIEHERRSKFQCTLYFPIDEAGRWRYITEFSRLKVPMRYHDEQKPQIFIITEIEKSMGSSGKRQLKVSAEHISYALRGAITPPVGTPAESVTIGGAEGLSALLGLIGTTSENASLTHANNMTALIKQFTISSDISGAGALPLIRTERINLIDFLLNTYAPQYDAQVYRDNFDIIINQEMPGRKIAGVIRYGINMIDIDCAVDTSEVYTNVIANSEPDVFTPIYYEMPANDLAELPYRRYKQIKVSYDTELISEVSSDTLDSIRQIFARDSKKWAEYHFKPLINLRVSFADIENNAYYSDFLGLRQHEVGDLVSVYHEGLDITFTELEVIRTKFDVCRQQITDMEVGDFRASFTRGSYDFSNITEV